MNYPFWDIPHLGSGWVIGIIAIFHVMISQFAVGGGFYLPQFDDCGIPIEFFVFMPSRRTANKPKRRPQRRRRAAQAPR